MLIYPVIFITFATAGLFNGFNNLLQTCLGVLAVASFAWVGFNRSEIVRLRESNAELREDIKDKDRRIDEGAEKQLLSDQKIESLETQLDALGKVVTGEAHWVAISHELEDHSERAERHWDRSEAIMEGILKVLGGKLPDDFVPKHS